MFYLIIYCDSSLPRSQNCSPLLLVENLRTAKVSAPIWSALTKIMPKTVKNIHPQNSILAEKSCGCFLKTAFPKIHDSSNPGKYKCTGALQPMRASAFNSWNKHARLVKLQSIPRPGMFVRVIAGITLGQAELERLMCVTRPESVCVLCRHRLYSEAELATLTSETGVD